MSGSAGSSSIEDNDETDRAGDQTTSGALRSLLRMLKTTKNISIGAMPIRLDQLKKTTKVIILVLFFVSFFE
jgi:hypothetical protein